MVLGQPFFFQKRFFFIWWFQKRLYICSMQTTQTPSPMYYFEVTSKSTLESGQRFENLDNWAELQEFAEARQLKGYDLMTVHAFNSDGYKSTVKYQFDYEQENWIIIWKGIVGEKVN